MIFSYIESKNPGIQPKRQCVFFTQNPRILSNRQCNFLLLKIRESKAYRIQESRNPAKKDSVIFSYSESKNPGIQPKRQCGFFDSESKNPVKKTEQVSFNKNLRIKGLQNPRIQESSQKRQCDFFLLRIQESRNPAKKTVQFFLTQNPRIQTKKTVKFSYTQNPRIHGLWDPRIQLKKTV